MSGLVAAGYLVAAYVFTDSETMFKVVMFLFLPMGCIWFSEEMGSFTGFMHGRYITSTSPGCAVAAVGWILLLLPVILWLIAYFNEST